MEGVTLRWTSIPSGGGLNALTRFMLQKQTWMSSCLLGHLARMQTVGQKLNLFFCFFKRPISNSSVCDVYVFHATLWIHVDRLQLTLSPPCWMTINKRIIISSIVPVIQYGRQGLCRLNLTGMVANQLYGVR